MSEETEAVQRVVLERITRRGSVRVSTAGLLGRALQALRRKGAIKFDTKLGWSVK